MYAARATKTSFLPLRIDAHNDSDTKPRDCQRPFRDRSRDRCKLRRDAETVKWTEFKYSAILRSLRLRVFYDGLWNGLWQVSDGLWPFVEKPNDFLKLGCEVVLVREFASLLAGARACLSSGVCWD